MDSRSLKQFLALSRTLHFARAAELCHLSPSALSRSIRRLEQELGCRLFDRNNREVKLTPEGRTLLLQAEELSDRLASLEHNLRAGQDQLSGTISLYCSVTASYSLLAGLLPEFRQRYPGIEIKVHTGDQALAIERVALGQEDVVIAARPDQWPEALSFLELALTPLVFIAPLEGVGAHAVSPQPSAAHFDGVPMILPEGGLARTYADRWFYAHHLTPTLYAQVTGNEAIVSMVALGCGVGVVPLLVLRGSPFVDRVRVLDVTPALPPFRIGLCARNASLENPMIRALWDLAAERALRG